MPRTDSAQGRRTADELLPEGVEPPADVPQEIFAAALGRFLACERLDMRALAAELGIGRATLYRRVGGRDHLLGAVIWFLTRHAIARALPEGEGLEGRARIVALMRAFMRDIHSQPALHRLLDAEPEAALRILTSKAGPVQAGLIDVVHSLLEEEEHHATLSPGIDRSTLAYVIVRVGESFLYADVIADNDPDVDLAAEVIGRMLS